MATRLLPPELITLSACLTEFAFTLWWDRDNVAEAARFGVDEQRFDDVVAWYRQRFGDQFGAPNVAYSTAVIRSFIREFVSDVNGLAIIGCALADDDREVLKEQRRGVDRGGRSGVHEMLDRGERLRPGGRFVGFEPLSSDHGLGCSWLCNALERDAEAVLGIRPDPRSGLLATYALARRVTDHVNRDDVAAEPGPWLPWMVVTYPL